MILVTGSAGHLGEALMRVLRGQGIAARGLDIKASAFTDHVGSITDRDAVRAAMRGVTAVLHSATLHKPHAATHSAQDFVDTNVSGTWPCWRKPWRRASTLSCSPARPARSAARSPPAPGAPAAWIDEDVTPIPRNIYGATKLGAEALCEMIAHRDGLPVIVLRTSRFFPEEDDRAATRSAFSRDNIQLLELLYRRGDVADMASAHLKALDAAPRLGFGRYIVSATSPFTPGDLAGLHRDAQAVVTRLYPDAVDLFAARGWQFLPKIDRVYDNSRARRDLGWTPVHDFNSGLECLKAGRDFRSDLARSIGAKGYHDEVFADGPYPVD